MRSVAYDVRVLGGIAAKHELLARGHTAGAVFAAVRDGNVTRIRKGWYANTDVHRDVLRAWRVGGRLACVSAAQHHQLWVPEHSGDLHVSVLASASQLRRPTDHRRRLAADPDSQTRIHWTGLRSSDRTAVSIPLAIEQIFKCQPATTGFVVLESALHLQRMNVRELSDLTSRLSVADRRLVTMANSQSESGSESFLKLILARTGIPFRQQVEIPNVGRVDFLVGERLVIEADSKAHHSEPFKDRQRDAQLSIEGYRSLRFMYSQIVFDPELVEAAIISALIRDDHRRA